MWSCSIHAFLRVSVVTGRNSQPRKQAPCSARNLFCRGLYLTWAVLPITWHRPGDWCCPPDGVIPLAFTVSLEDAPAAFTPLWCVSPCPEFNSLCVCQSVCSSMYKISSLLRVVSKLCLPFRKEKQTFHRRSCFLWVSVSPFYSHSWLAVQLQFLNNTSWYSVWYLVKVLSREFYRIF